MDSLKKFCKYEECHQEIIYMKMKSGNRMPVNWDSLDAEEKKSAMMGIEVPYVRLKDNGMDFKHISHFATCKKPKLFRK